MYCIATVLKNSLLLMIFILRLDVVLLLVCEELFGDWVEGVAGD